MIGHGMMGWGGLGSYGWIGLILNLVFTVAVIVGIVWLVVWLARRSGAGAQNAGGTLPQSQSPREILQTRYARGEITRDQYHQMIEDLG